MKTVWVIESGSYSDYRVRGVYTSKENAEKVLEHMPVGEASISEWPLNPGLEETMRELGVYNVLMLYNGDVESVSEEDRSCRYMYMGERERAFVWDRPNIPAHRGKYAPECLNATVWAKNKKHAVKIVNEIRTRMIASGEWKP